MHYKGSATEQLSGLILLLKAPSIPYDPHLRQLCPFKPLAIIILRYDKGIPGKAMYFTDGLDRRSIDCIVIEAFMDGTQDASKMPDGTSLQIQVETNPWKHVKETKFQAIVGSLLSAWEVIIILMGAYRLNQFFMSGATKGSIGPLCLMFEIGAVLVRLAYTLVDPFWTYRMLHTTASNILFTAHYPFGLCSGILLTFYCTWNSIFPPPTLNGFSLLLIPAYSMI